MRRGRIVDIRYERLLLVAGKSVIVRVEAERAPVAVDEIEVRDVVDSRTIPLAADIEVRDVSRVGIFGDRLLHVAFFVLSRIRTGKVA